jgi:phospholipid/cholesterol/gamma-HCH transport system substrate-binding protein
MGSRIVETLVGTFVLLVAGFFLAYAYTTAGVSGTSSTYSIAASFDRVDGLSVGSDVRMSGIKIGTVTEQILDPETFLARVELSIDKSIELPEDTSAKVASDGLLGGAYISLEAGGAMDLLAEGDEIEFTQGSIDLMALVGQAIFSFSGSEGTKSE